MPVLILLDSSLSMSRLVSNDETSIKDLAQVAINVFLDYLSQNNPLEFVALATFSSSFNLHVAFTRDHTEVRSILPSLIEEDSTSMKGALTSACSCLHLEWGLLLPTQILMITDAEDGLEKERKKCEEDILFNNSTCTFIMLNLSPHPPPISTHPSSFHSITASSSHSTSNLPSAIGNLLKTYFPSRHKIYTPDHPLTTTTITATINTFSPIHFLPSHFLLRSGNHQSEVTVYPAVVSPNNQPIWKEIVVCGTLLLSDLSNPPFHSRHLILPVFDPSDDKESADKQATFTVLLHGSLKVENMIALVQISTDWFGIIYVQSDSKKKSNLNLSLFNYGQSSVPWLGSFKNLTPISQLDDVTLKDKVPFPLTTYPEKKSYSLNCVVWTHNVGLQGDIQKIIRNGRKMPEKQSQFYKELNRVRKAALSIGFLELFPSLASLLERESTCLPPTHHPSTPLQLNHAAKVLRSPKALDVNHHIHPLVIN